MKERYIHFALIGLGAVIVLLLLMRRVHHASNGSLVADGSIPSPPEYPNGSPIGDSSFIVGGSPLNLTYNTLPNGGALPSVIVGNGGSVCPCSDDPCESAQTLTTLNRVPDSAMSAAVANFEGFQSKLVSELQAAPVATVDM